MITAISKYMPRWLMAIIATALVLATLVGSSQDSAEAIDPADTDTVYIADGTNFADALMGATIAALNTSPMLGVAGTNGGDTIPGDTIEELDRLTNNKADLLDTIYIFGGTSAVSADVQIQLEEWANDIQRIEGDSRWGTYQAISQLLPSAIDEAVHAQEADHATEADNADTLDGMDSGEFALSDQACAAGQVVTGIAADGTPTCAADQVDGGNADTLDGLDSTAFAGSGHDHLVTNASEPNGIVSAGTSAVSATLDLTINDMCPGAADAHNLQILATGNTQESDETDMTFQLRVDGTVVATTETTIDDQTVTAEIPFSVSALATDIDSGAHTIDLFSTNDASTSTGVDNVQLTVERTGWTCP